MSVSAANASPASPAPALRSPRRTRRLPAWARRVLLVGLAFAAAAIALHFLSHELTDDSYAFLDWGRDLRHHYVPPLLENRTFHPIPILAGALLSLLGSAAPGATVLCAVAGLVLLAAGAWQVCRLLELRQPAPAFAALLIVTSPMLVAISFAAYINLPFAVLIVWALVWELRQRPRLTWTLLVIAGLVRPEGWAFLLAYGALEWWRAGRPLLSRRLAVILLLAVGPMTLWLFLEWRFFGTPLYSFTNTRAPAGTVQSSSSLHGLWTTLKFCLALPGLIASVIGAVAIWRLAPRRPAATVLGATLVAALTVAFLATSKFNVPDRHFSAFVSLLCVLAAAGATAPAQWLARRRPSAGPQAVIAVGLAGVVLVVALAASTVHQKLSFDFAVFRVERVTGNALDATIARSRVSLDVRGAREHSVASTAAVVESELVWDLGVPYNAVDDRTSNTTQLLVQPSPGTWELLERRRLTDRTIVAVPRGWTSVTAGAWMLWSPQAARPVRLGAPPGR